MTGTSLFGGGLIAGDALAALGLGLDRARRARRRLSRAAASRRTCHPCQGRAGRTSPQERNDEIRRKLPLRRRRLHGRRRRSRARCRATARSASERARCSGSCRATALKLASPEDRTSVVHLQQASPQASLLPGLRHPSLRGRAGPEGQRDGARSTSAVSRTSTSARFRSSTSTAARAEPAPIVTESSRRRRRGRRGTILTIAPRRGSEIAHDFPAPARSLVRGRLARAPRRRTARSRRHRQHARAPSAPARARRLHDPPCRPDRRLPRRQHHGRDRRARGAGRRHVLPAVERRRRHRPHPALDRQARALGAEHPLAQRSLGGNERYRLAWPGAQVVATRRRGA